MRQSLRTMPTVSKNPSGRWMASLRETIHLPQGYLSGASSITKSEPQRGPHDLAFDELTIGNLVIPAQQPGTDNRHTLILP